MQHNEANDKKNVWIYDRKKIELDGVLSVLTFDESYVLLEMSNDCVGIDGAELKIENLSKENGKITIVGRIDGLSYNEGRRGKRAWFKGRA